MLASVQRLRAQAAEVGNLKSSPEMTVDETTAERQDRHRNQTRRSTGRLRAAVQPADGLYRSRRRRPRRPRRRTPTSGLSTDEAVMGGLLAFGAGILVANVFDDDDDDYWLRLSELGLRRRLLRRRRPYYPAQHVRLCAALCAGIDRPPVTGRRGTTATTIATPTSTSTEQQLLQPLRQEPEPRVELSGEIAGDAETVPRAAAVTKAPTGRATTAANGGGPATGPAGGASGAYKGGDSGAYKGAAQNRQGTSASRREAAHAAQRSARGADRGYPKASGSRPDVAAASANRGGGSFSGCRRQSGRP